MDRTTFNKMLGVAAFAGLTEPNESNAQSVGHVFLSKLSGEEVTLSDGSPRSSNELALVNASM